MAIKELMLFTLNTGDYKITIMQYDVPREVLQIIEDGLSDKLKPAFGKQGGNNK